MVPANVCPNLTLIVLPLIFLVLIKLQFTHERGSSLFLLGFPVHTGTWCRCLGTFRRCSSGRHRRILGQVYLLGWGLMLTRCLGLLVRLLPPACLLLLFAAVCLLLFVAVAAIP